MRRNILAVIARGVHHDLAADLTLFGFHDPFIALPVNAGNGAAANDRRAAFPRAGGIGLGQLRGVDIAIQRIPKPAFQVMMLHLRDFLAQIVEIHHFHHAALAARHVGHMREFAHPFVGMGDPYGTGLVIVDRISDLVAESREEVDRIGLDRHDGPVAREGWAITSGVPGRARRQFGFFEKNHIGPTGLRQMVKRRTADRAATNDDDAGGRGKICHMIKPWFYRGFFGTYRRSRRHVRARR